MFQEANSSCEKFNKPETLSEILAKKLIVLARILHFAARIMHYFARSGKKFSMDLESFVRQNSKGVQ